VLSINAVMASVIYSAGCFEAYYYRLSREMHRVGPVKR